MESKIDELIKSIDRLNSFSWGDIISLVALIGSWITIFILLKDKHNENRPYLQVTFELVRSNLTCVVLRNVGKVPLVLTHIHYDEDFINQLDERDKKYLNDNTVNNLTIFPGKEWIVCLGVIVPDILNKFELKKLKVNYEYKKLNGIKTFKENTEIDFEQYSRFLVYISEIDELKQVNEFRSNMIDTVSHEFRTPLTSILGYTSRLLRQDIQIDEATRQKSLKIIKKQSERLRRMIEDLLVIPDIEGARLNENITNIQINTVIENSILLIKNDAHKEIINNLEDCNIEVLADNDRIEQVFVNLIENAIKYSKENSPITLDYEIREDMLVVSVQNDYDVIPREKLKTLFDKFTRVDDSTTRTTRGTGLGLFIVKGLVEAMNGEIRLYSNEKCGFCVKVFLHIADFR